MGSGPASESVRSGSVAVESVAVDDGGSESLEEEEEGDDDARGDIYY